MPDRLARALCCALLSLAAGCTTVTASADRAVPARELGPAALRAAALEDDDLGDGYAVTAMAPAAPLDARRGHAELPGCQLLLDLLAPGRQPAGEGVIGETDLSVAKTADPNGSVYARLIAYRSGRAEQERSELTGALAHCGNKEVTAGRRLAQLDTPTPEGADSATAFTLTSETAPARVLLLRVGTVLAAFSTVGPDTQPDDQVVEAQVAKLRAAQA